MRNPPVNLIVNVQLNSVLFTSHVFQLALSETKGPIFKQAKWDQLPRNRQNP